MSTPVQAPERADQGELVSIAIGSRLVGLIPWAVAGLVLLLALFTVPGPGGSSYGTPGFVGLSLLFGAFLFMRGGPRLDAASMVNLAFFLFVGVAGWQAIRHPDKWQVGYLAVAVLYFSQIITAVFLSYVHAPRRGSLVEAIHAQWVFFAGVVYLVGGVVLDRAGAPLGPMPNSAAFVGAVLVGGYLLGAKGAVSIPRIIASCGGLLVYATLVFTGYGRLTVAALVLALAIFLSIRLDTRAVKFAVLVAMGPAWILASDVQATALTGEAFSRGDGSAISPLIRFGELLDLSILGHLAAAWGETYFASLVALVPGAWWSGKPIGFGAELAWVFTPQYAPYGHSEAALFQGESIYNFGLIGLLAGAAFLGIAVNWLGGKQATLTEQNDGGATQFLLLVCVVVASAGLLDLYWAGTFTYVARTGSRLLSLLPLLVLARGVHGWSTRESRFRRMKSA